MKNILKLLCWVLAVYAVWFPFSYFGKIADRKEIRISHIMVKNLEDAEKIKKNIDEGKKFEDMLNDEKICNKDTLCGDLGYAPKGRLEPQIENAVYKMAKNQVSNPIDSHSGWHVLKVTEVNYFSENKNFKYDKFKYLDL